MMPDNTTLMDLPAEYASRADAIRWVRQQLTQRPDRYHADVTFPIKWCLFKFFVLESEALSIAADENACVELFRETWRRINYYDSMPGGLGFLSYLMHGTTSDA